MINVSQVGTNDLKLNTLATKHNPKVNFLKEISCKFLQKFLVNGAKYSYMSLEENTHANSTTFLGCYVVNLFNLKIRDICLTHFHLPDVGWQQL